MFFALSFSDFCIVLCLANLKYDFLKITLFTSVAVLVRSFH